MLCRNPFIGRGGAAYPCGQCMPCRISRRRVWTHRILLEASLQKDNAFITLTYSDENLVFTSTGLPTLQPVHLKNWLKRFRKSLEPSRIRFYGAGEYGDDSQRPHYHVAVFGFPTCARGRTLRRPESGTRPLWRDCCTTCRLVGNTWGFGDVDLGTLAPESAQYICGYVTKKMTALDDTRLYGRHPEFSRQSNRPGIGHGFLHEIASTLMQFNLEDTQADVPSALRHGTRLLPLGRYLRSELRKLVGMDASAPEATLAEAAARLQDLRESAFNNSRSFKKEIIKAADQKVLNMETKQRIHRKVRTL